MNSQGQIKNNQSHEWFHQVQGQLHIAKKNWTGTDFPLKVVTVVKYVFWQEKTLPKLTQFYLDCILPEIIDPRKARSMPLRRIY